MTEKEVLQDLLIAHKFLLSMYNQFGLECSNKTIRNMFNLHHSTVSKHNFEVFTMMKDKGLYPVMEAEEQQINTAIEMHTEMQEELNKKVK